MPKQDTAADALRPRCWYCGREEHPTYNCVTGWVYRGNLKPETAGSSSGVPVRHVWHRERPAPDVAVKTGDSET